MPKLAMAYSFSRPIHSTEINSSSKINMLNGIIVGAVNNDPENVSEIYLNASPMLSDLKKTQANTVKPNVTAIERASFNVGKYLPLATISKLFLFVLTRMEGIIYRAFKKPQARNVQFAPCQKPLTKNMMNVFLTFIQVPPLLPPSGI
jgi:hypothetical protein